MPWQAQIFIGVPVYDLDDVKRVAAGLRFDPSGLDEDTVDNGDVFKEIEVIHEGTTHVLNICFHKESEGGSRFHDPEDIVLRKSLGYADAIVGCGLTARYRGAVLDAGIARGRPEPFVLDLDALQDILRQVRTVWPEAQVLIWEVFY